MLISIRMEFDLGWITALLLILTTLYFALRRPAPLITVTDLVYYPVKGCAGVHLKSAQIDETGIKFDRMWAICDQNHAMINLKIDPNLMRIVPELLLNAEGNLQTLILRHGAKEFRLQVDKELTGDPFEITVFRHPRKVRSEGPAAAAFLKEALKADYMLVRVAELREPHAEFKTKYDTKVNLAAALHLHLVAEESMEALRHAMPEKNKGMLIDTFRGNVTVKGAPAFEEDTWGEIVINNVKMVTVKPVRRCPVPTIHPDTLEYDENQEPNTTLKRMHAVEGLPMFGGWLIRMNNGIINVGDRVRVVRWRKFTNKVEE